jgi:predicted permease
MFQQIVSIVAPLFAIVAVGYFYGSRVRPEMRITNQLIMDVFMPALIFHVMIQEDFYPAQYLGLIVAGVLLMLGSGVLAYLFAKLLGFTPRSFMPPAMFSNWANLGLPLYVLALGQQALDGGVMLVVVGNILCFTLGVYVYSGKLSGWEVLKTPIIIAVVLGLAVNAAGLPIPKAVDLPIDMLGKVAIPLMLFSLGVRLTRVSWGDYHVGLAMAIFCPVVGVGLAILLAQILPLSELHQNILILFGVLPPAVINFMLAEQYNSDPDQVASMVIIGNLASLISIPAVLYFVLSSSA